MFPSSLKPLLFEFQSTLPTRGSDDRRFLKPLPVLHFNPRSPRGGATQSMHRRRGKARFQSTLPTRGSDFHVDAAICIDRHFNPRSPRGGATWSTAWQKADIGNFNPRSPRGGATGGRPKKATESEISIHAPHEGERRRKSAFVYSISANLLNIIHCGTVTRAVSRRRIALFRLFSVRRSGVFMYAYASH